MRERPDGEHDAKSIAFYSAIVEAWVATRMEKDRTLVSLAAGGIGLVATLLTTVGPSSMLDLGLFGIAAISFAVTIVTGIWVFEYNSRHLEAVIENGIRGDEPALVRLDQAVFWSFLLGVAFTAAAGLSQGYNRIQGGSYMAQDEQTTTRVTNPPERKSLSGIGNLAPQSPASPMPTAEPTSATPAPPTNAQGGAPGGAETLKQEAGQPAAEADGE